MVKEFIASRDCPKDCPFLDRIASGKSRPFCSFAMYADIIEPGRHCRTELNEDGTVNYNIPPNCNVYEKYKGQSDIVKSAKRKLKYEIEVRRGVTSRERDSDLIVTGHKHPAVQNRHKK